MYQECRHIKPNGSRCKSPALKEKAYCYFHIRVHKIARNQSAPAIPYEQQDLEIPFLEDRGAVQVALSEVVGALATRRVDFKRAALMIYALQVASSNAKNPADLVALQPVREASENDQGEELAPELTTYEPDDEEYDDDREPTLAELLMGGIKLRQEAHEADRKREEAYRSGAWNEEEDDAGEDENDEQDYIEGGEYGQQEV